MSASAILFAPLPASFLPPTDFAGSASPQALPFPSRDVFEQQWLLPRLNLTGWENVLDIGCGHGRWARTLTDRIRCYHGIDFNAELIRFARARNLPSSDFQCLPAQALSVRALRTRAPFDLFICANLLAYLNDADVALLGQSIANLAAPGARLYLRETEASSALFGNLREAEQRPLYGSITRPPEELDYLFGATLEAAGFVCDVAQSLFPDELCSPRDPQQHVQIWRRPD